MWATGRPERNAAEAGFTLIEMLAVLGIMALIAGLTFAASGRLLTRAALGQARFDTLALLVEARADARMKGRTIVVSATRDGAALTATGRPRRAMPAAVAVATPAPVRFFADGTSSGGVVALAAEQQTLTVQVTPANGLARAVAP